MDTWRCDRSSCCGVATGSWLTSITTTPTSWMPAGVAHHVVERDVAVLAGRRRVHADRSARAGRRPRRSVPLAATAFRSIATGTCTPSHGQRRGHSAGPAEHGEHRDAHDVFAVSVPSLTPSTPRSPYRPPGGGFEHEGVGVEAGAPEVDAAPLVSRYVNSSPSGSCRSTRSGRPPSRRSRPQSESSPATGARLGSVAP